jgi:hypothetical protein
MTKKLCFTALILLLAVAVFAQTEADFEVGLTEDGNGVVIAKYTGKTAVVRIPATIQGMPVKEIGGSLAYPSYAPGAFSGNGTITSVVIPEGVTIIGDAAFSSCNKLTSVTIPEGVVKIGEIAFRFSPLTAVTLPQSLKVIGNAAFSKTNISAITIPAGVTVEGDQEGGVFEDCKNLKTVTISEGVTTIAKNMFRGCPVLTSIALPASIERIKEYAFAWCSTLTSVTVPASVTAIDIDGSALGGSAFQGCPKLNLATQALLKKLGYQGSFN